MHQKGFFKTILGNWLKEIDKPYYTFLDDYVVFSNSEDVLKSFIDDFITGKTLSHNEDFLDFKADLQNKSNVFVYIQMPKLYHILKQNLTADKQKSLNDRKALILSFSRIGLQLIAKDDLFKTLAVIDHDEKAMEKEQAEQLAQETDESIHNNFFEDVEFKIAFPDSLQYGNGQYHKYYKDGQTLALEGKIQDNLPVGIWRSYYPSGNLQSVINYDNGEVNGEMFYYYDKPDELMVQTNYDHDLLSGDYFEYWPNGAIKAKLHYKDGKLNGDAIFYYKTGQVKIEGKYRNGEKKGKWLFYDQKGNVTHKKRYSGFIF
ncbi:MAG TPA: toxin-antitoxin system YwqK family antitoxin [Flavobacteriales bacterium]|nr:toxin-antitoxin system YwqK family antitoxin [Flavobacteriales bacterium]